ncbi:MAG: PIN domain-containing protein [Candidatus Heimdallarchaeota archaeon]
MNKIESFAADGGVLLALALNEHTTLPLKEKILNGVASIYTHHYALTELLYVICRTTGMETARRKLHLLEKSRVVTIISPEELIDYAAREKCNRRIALADCFTIALAIFKSCVALFARKERELLESMKQKPFPIPIRFLKDI